MKKTLAVAAVLALVPLLAGMAKKKKDLLIIGGGETILAGGNGSLDLNTLAPVKTRFAFRVHKPAGGLPSGFFECIAVTPPSASGQGSGDFTENMMYVTGVINGLEMLDKRTAKLTGLVRCTNLGAGNDVGLEVIVTEGGPGARLFLSVDTLPDFPFEEIVTSGQIQFKKVKP